MTKLDNLESENNQLQQELEEEHNLKKKFEELYSEEREKNLALRKLIGEGEEKKKPSARPRSTSKYGRKTDPNIAKAAEEKKKVEPQGTQDDFGSNASDEKEILLNKIQFSDIENIAQQLKTNFKKFKVDEDQIVKILPKGQTTLTELKDLLSKKYNMDDGDALLISR